MRNQMPGCREGENRGGRSEGEIKRWMEGKNRKEGKEVCAPLLSLFLSCYMKHKGKKKKEKKRKRT